MGSSTTINLYPKSIILYVIMNSKVPPELIWSLVAIIGGVAKYVKMHLEGRKTFKLIDFLARVFVSGFSGYMFGHAMFLINSEWVIVASGIGGYMGAEALDYLVNIIKIRYNTNDESRK